jgi:hypothetical protein
MRRASRSLCYSLLLALTGCYSYTVAPPEEVPVGAAIRARISAAEAERVSLVVQQGKDRVLEGALVQSDPESLLISVASEGGTFGSSATRLHQRLTIPRSEIFELEVRRLDPWRTAGVVAAATAVASYIVIRAFDLGGNAPAGPRPGEEQAQTPLGSVPIW